jgi:hypothetical protein
MQGNTGHFPYSKFRNVTKDERFTDGVIVGNGTCTTRQSGRIYSLNALNYTYMKTKMLDKITCGYFNSDMQFSIAAATFNNAFYVFHKYENAYLDK